MEQSQVLQLTKEKHHLHRRYCPVQTVLNGYQTGYQRATVNNQFGCRNALATNHLLIARELKNGAQMVIKIGYQRPVHGLYPGLAGAEANEPHRRWGGGV